MKELYVWVDDIRFPPESYVKKNFASAESVNQAKDLIRIFAPYFDKIIIDLDHDLGDFAFDGGDGYKLVIWLIKKELNTEKFEIRCHSMNPVGKEHILGLYNRYWKKEKS